MNKKILPVDKYDFRQVILALPSYWIPGKGFCVPIGEINNAIDDILPLSKEDLIDYILGGLKKASKTPKEADFEENLSKILSYNEVREYVGMKPLNGYDEFLNVGD